MSTVYIVASKRTPIGSFQGVFSGTSATKLGAAAIKGAIDQVGITPESIDEVFMGNVLSANLGQAPARQASIFAGIPDTVPCTTINKVCASGMKATMFGAQSILCGDNNIVVVGGMENMSQVPYYLPSARIGMRLGDNIAVDGLVKDGLTDVYNAEHMGNAAELCARDCNISREAQDEYALLSYQRSADAWKTGKFESEITAVEVHQRKGDPLSIAEDEEYKNVIPEKVPGLRPVFQKDGTVTAANASTLNDGAAALILASEEAVKKHNLKPLARIASYADSAQAPEWFTTAPALALPKAVEKAGLDMNDISLFEINEAFSVVSLANIQKMKLDPQKVNIYGGAVSLGHPLGCSGARILVTLINALQQTGETYGAAGICNGGGGASAMVIERL